MNRWRLLHGRRQFCDHDRNDVIESTGGDEFIGIHFVFDSAIVPPDEDRLFRHPGHRADVLRPVRCPSLPEGLTISLIRNIYNPPPSESKLHEVIDAVVTLTAVCFAPPLPVRKLPYTPYDQRPPKTRPSSLAPLPVEGLYGWASLIAAIALSRASAGRTWSVGSGISDGRWRRRGAGRGLDGRDDSLISSSPFAAVGFQLAQISIRE